MLPSPESEAHVTPCMTQPLLNCRICVGSRGSGKLSFEQTKAYRKAYGGMYLTYDADPICFSCTKYLQPGRAICRKTATGPRTADRNVDLMRRKTAVRTQTARGNRNSRSGEYTEHAKHTNPDQMLPCSACISATNRRTKLQQYNNCN